MKVYLCGPINGAEAKDWREAVKREHPEFTYIDPMRNDYRGRENEVGIDKLIVEQDKFDVYDADALLVNYSGPSVGTSMEILYAWEIGRPVVLVSKPGTVMSPWLTYHVTRFEPSFFLAFEALKDIDANGAGLKAARLRGRPVA